jgi:flavin reductase (DIM6/NTAB) family NADH-FMN oxidoreductase RutF
MEKELEFCGSHSGRDGNKFTQGNLHCMPGKMVTSPVIKLSGIHFECKIVYKASINQKMLIDEYERWYPGKDYHTHYYGEIVECYST